MVGRGSRHWVSPRVLAKVMGMATVGTACLVAWIPCSHSIDFGNQVRGARINVKQLHELVGIHQQRTGKLPSYLWELTKQNGHREPLLSELTMDPWNNDYQLVIETPSKWKVVSWGPDGSEGGDDDISSETQERRPE